MASLVYLNRLKGQGGEVHEALEQIRNGLATLRKREGARAQTIAVSPTTFGAAFGVADVAQAQAFSDRLGAINGGVYTGLNDLLDATIALDDPGA